MTLLLRILTAILGSMNLHIGMVSYSTFISYAVIHCDTFFVFWSALLLILKVTLLFRHFHALLFGNMIYPGLLGVAIFINCISEETGSNVYAKMLIMGGRPREGHKSIPPFTHPSFLFLPYHLIPLIPLLTGSSLTIWCHSGKTKIPKHQK